jgi:hypothetical protein
MSLCYLKYCELFHGQNSRKIFKKKMGATGAVFCLLLIMIHGDIVTISNSLNQIVTRY